MIHNGSESFWKFATTFLSGVVLTLTIVWFTHVRDAATKSDLGAINNELKQLGMKVVELTVRLEVQDRAKK